MKRFNYSFQSIGFHYKIFVFTLLIFACQPPKEKEIFPTENNLELKTFFTSGELKRIRHINKDSILHGEFVEYYKNGLIRQQLTYVNGIQEGIAKTFYPNGNLESIHNYHAAFPHGNYKWYFENGQVKETGHFKDGQLTGESFAYYKTGEKKAAYYFEKNNKRKTNKEFYKNGNLRILSYYNEFGQLIFQCSYDEKEKPLKIKGEAIIDLKLKANPLNKTIAGDIEICIPPEFDGKLKVEKYLSKKKKVIKLDKQIKNSGIYQLKDEFKRRRPGEYKFRVTLELICKDNVELNQKYYKEFFVNNVAAFGVHY